MENKLENTNQSDPSLEFMSNMAPEFYEKLKIHYPKAFEREIPLSVTGISSWTFFDWKKKGLIPFEADNDRVKLNVIEYVWIRAIQEFREFGLPYAELAHMKDYLFNTNLFFEALEHAEEVIKKIEENRSHSLEEIDLIKKAVEFIRNNLDENSLTDKSILTVFASYIFKMLLLNEDVVLLAAKKIDGSGLVFFVHTYKELHSTQLLEGLFYRNHVLVCIKPLLLELLNLDNLEKYAIRLGLLTADEHKVLMAIRERNYSEIIIQTKGENDIVIDVIDEVDVREEKAKEIRMLLGLNKYDEIQLKYRNEKHLFVKNRKRLK